MAGGVSLGGATVKPAYYRATERGYHIKYLPYLMVSTGCAYYHLEFAITNAHGRLHYGCGHH